MRSFNTSGPNVPSQHYTIRRTDLIHKGLRLVEQERYFTIWAPRQTGKSTYFRQLAEELEGLGYKVAHINFENFQEKTLAAFLSRLSEKLEECWIEKIAEKTITGIFLSIERSRHDKMVLIIDRADEINNEYFGDFLSAIRSAFHSRQSHGLKSVILVGLSNIVGLAGPNSVPYNISDELNVPYFTDHELRELLGQHERETGQRFHDSVKAKIAEITACQPGLANGFAKVLVENNPSKPELDLQDYLKVEDWYLTEAIDKNFENILSKARQEREFVERLLFTEARIPFEIDRPSIKLLHTNGLIRKDKDGNVEFWVPFYKKRLHKAFYPYTNGEGREISRTIYAPEYFAPEGGLMLEKLVQTYKEYVKRRGFNPHREKDADGKFKSIREAALIYSFETFIHAIVNELSGKIYREAQTGLGKSDMVINVRGQEVLIETKIYSSPQKFENGKRQLAYYARSLSLDKGVYLVYCPNDIRYPDIVKEDTVTIEGVEVSTFLVEYDETKW